MLGFAPLASTALADDIGFAAYDLVADAGSFVATGQDANFATSEIIGTGVFTCTAQDAGLFLTKVADAGSFSATGQDVGFRLDAKVIAQQGTFLIAAQQVTDSTRKVAAVGQFALEGQTSGLNYLMAADNASFSHHWPRSACSALQCWLALAHWRWQVRLRTQTQA